MRGAALVDRHPEALDVRLARVIRLPRVLLFIDLLSTYLEEKFI